MNILFFTTYKISPTKGGTEHTTLTVASQLHKRYKCKCWAVHVIDALSPNCSCFENQFYIGRVNFKQKLKKILIDNQIDIALSEGGFYFTRYVNEIREEKHLKIKNIFVHHFTPGWEENFENKVNYLQDLKYSSGKRKIKAAIKILIYPYLKHRHLKKLPEEYHNTYYMSDATVLLTKGYVPLFKAYGNIKDCSKFYVIPNALSFPYIFNKKDYYKTKQNTILIVARLEEMSKRISVAIKIWEKVSKDIRSEGWNLLIGGDGIFRKEYEKYITTHDIKRIQLLGSIYPEPYYNVASIYMMTSKKEGFPLTLNEAMQYGVVPLAFDSFESVHDIINDGENGFIIPEMDMKKYSDKLLELISNKELRHKMAMNAIDSCQRYIPERIGEMWWDLINKNL